MALLVVFAMMPVPLALIHAVLRDRAKQTARDSEIGQYSIVNTDECETPLTDMSQLDRRGETTDS